MDLKIWVQSAGQERTKQRAADQKLSDHFTASHLGRSDVCGLVCDETSYISKCSFLALRHGGHLHGEPGDVRGRAETHGPSASPQTPTEPLTAACFT